MSVAAEGPPRGGGLLTAVVLGFSTGVLGLLGGLPLAVGPSLGVAGVAGSAVWRAHRRGRSGVLPFVPALGATAIVAATAAPAPSTELFAGLTGLAFLLWVADDPARPAGGGRRAGPTIALAAVGVALAWTITLALPGRTPDVALGGGLLAAALVILAVLLARLPSLAPRPARNA